MRNHDQDDDAAMKMLLLQVNDCHQRHSSVSFVKSSQAMSIGYGHGYNERDHSRHVSSRFVFLKNKACEDERHPIT